MTRRLTLRKETLTDLTPADLEAVRAAGYTPDTYITWICTPLATAILRAVTQVASEATGC